jgi:hypothetical protein
MVAAMSPARSRKPARLLACALASAAALFALAAPAQALSATARASSHGGGKLSTAAIALAAVAALLAIGAAAWGVARVAAYEPRWTVSARHALAEAGFRVSSTWAEFSDWVRLGR